MIGVCVSSVSRAQPKVTLLGYLFSDACLDRSGTEPIGTQVAQSMRS